MGIYEKIKETQVSKGGNYFKPGNYRVKIKACKLVNSQAGPAKTFFVIECDVLQSDNPDIQIGRERSQVINMANVMGLPNVKQFVAAVSGIEPTSETVNEEVEAYWKKELKRRGLTDGEDVPFADICELVSDEKINLFQDIEMKLECTTILTKDKGGEFTKHNWQVRQV
jgi:hypothetical protein